MTQRVGTGRARIRRWQLAAIVLAACFITPAFNVLTSRATVASLFQGLVDAIVVALLAWGYLLFIRDARLRPWFRQLPFAAELTLSSAIVLGLFLLGRAFGQVVTTLDPTRFVTSFQDAHLIYALPFFVVLAATIQFLLQMNRMIGTNIPRYFVIGAYHRPREEQRVFLFLDLEGSTQLAERLGSTVYFQLLRRIVEDLTEPILDTAARLEEYAKRTGEELIASGTLLERLELAPGVEARACGDLALKGKGELVAAYALTCSRG